MTPSKTQLSHPKYRPDIDGLRAIAVLSVVAFHAFPKWAIGGFTGVDIFFVISGYLISTIIFENLDKGTFSFSDFYARRIKRIFPALFTVLIACYFFGWVALLPDEFKQLGKHFVAGTGFVSNLVWWSEAGYFDNSAESKPLLHLWSLGIEEQFYLVWPFLLWLGWKRKFNLLTLTVFFAAASLYFNISGVKKDAVATFYAPHTRFWELLGGSLLAWMTLYKVNTVRLVGGKLDGWLAAIMYREKPKQDGKILSNTLSFIGLLLLAYGFWRINKEVSFPGKWAVIPVLGAVLIIAAGPLAWVNRIILSNRLAIWFGLISYPLYLWHWPLLSFARIIEGETPSRTIRIATVALAIALAWLTYRLVERPLRSEGYSSRIKTAVLAALMVIVGGMGYGTYLGDGLDFRKVAKINTTIQTGLDGGHGGNAVAGCGISIENVKKYFFGCQEDRRGSIKYALYGDSKAGALYTGLFRTSTEHGRWIFIGGNGPSGGTAPLLTNDPKYAYSSYKNQAQVALDSLTKNKEINTIVLAVSIRALFQLSDGAIGGNIAKYDYKYMDQLATSSNYHSAFDGMDKTLSILSKAGKNIVLVVDNPALPNPKDCVARTTSINLLNRVFRNTNEDCRISLSEHNNLVEPYRKLLLELKKKYPDNVEIFDPTLLLCEGSKNICGVILNGRLLYSHTDHISDYAAGLIGKELNSFLNKKSQNKNN
jgi:peptidoglycan/LPS O-acetylase OafA/YrhL